MTNPNLPHKAAIVTGGAQGLGQAISQRLAREGCQVLIADVNEAGANATADAIAKETGQRVLGLKVDVTQEADVNALPVSGVRSAQLYWPFAEKPLYLKMPSTL